MKVLIVEDEQFAFEKLAMMLGRIDNTIEIVAHAKTITTAVDLIETGVQIDLALFDIQLADGLSFSIFDRVEINFPIIFDRLELGICYTSRANDIASDRSLIRNLFFHYHSGGL